MVKQNRISREDVLDFLRSIQQSHCFDLTIADPPYNIGKDFGNNKDNKTLIDYADWSELWINECLRLTKRSSPVYVYGLPEVLAHVAVRYPLAQQRWLTWHYTNKTVPGSKFWQRSFESILCLWEGEKPKLHVDLVREDYTPSFVKNSAGKVRHSKNCRFSNGKSTTIYRAHENGALPRDVMKIPALAGGAGYSERVFYCHDCKRLGMQKERHMHSDCRMTIHPTQKPQKITERLINAAGAQNLLIPFAGSGSECVVAKRMGVAFYATEMNPDYVKLGNAWLRAVAMDERPGNKVHSTGSSASPTSPGSPDFPASDAPEEEAATLLQRE